MPVLEARRDGFSGFFIGIGKGILGVFFKPFAGFLDAISKSTEGLKSTITYFDDKPNERKERVSRVFYGPEKFFKLYTQEAAESFNFFKTAKEGKYKEFYSMKNKN